MRSARAMHLNQSARHVQAPVHCGVPRRAASDRECDSTTRFPESKGASRSRILLAAAAGSVVGTLSG